MMMLATILKKDDELATDSVCASSYICSYLSTVVSRCRLQYYVRHILPVIGLEGPR